MNSDDLRDLLRDRADNGPPINPARHLQIEKRIGGLRRRRLTGAGATAAAIAVALTLTGVSGLTGGFPGRDGDAVTVAGKQARLPEWFTAGDGAEYRRLAKTTLDIGKEKEVSITTPVSGRPIDVAVPCVGDDSGMQDVDGLPEIDVSPRPSRAWPLFNNCRKGRMITPVQVAKGAEELTFTFRASSGERHAVGVRERRIWPIAVYEWTPPAEITAPPEHPAFPPETPDGIPDTGGREQLIKTASGVWPRDDVVTFSIPNRGRHLTLMDLCTGDLADWIMVDVSTVPARAGNPPANNCGVFNLLSSDTSSFLPLTLPKKDGMIKIKIKFRMDVTSHLKAYRGRPVRWSFGLYEAKS